MKNQRRRRELYIGHGKNSHRVNKGSTTALFSVIGLSFFYFIYINVYIHRFYFTEDDFFHSTAPSFFVSKQNKGALRIPHPPENEKYSDTCVSPEINATWILDGSCMKYPYTSTFSHDIRSCGLCGESANYLRTLRDEIAAKFERRCKDLVVYGTAFGEKYEEGVRSREYLLDSFQRHGTCFIQFITDSRNTGHRVSDDGAQELIIVDPSKLPYQNHRRNTKLFKFSPGLLFPWADRVIWQDAKMSDYAPSLPTNYHLHFNRTVERFGTCSSFMGLPPHPYAIGKYKSVILDNHCAAIIDGSKKRPTVSDNLAGLLIQCKKYRQKLHEEPLIDSAFIVYDMRSEECRQFNGDFGCSWLNEIHCYSDRDQISFPRVLASTGLKLPSTLQVPGQEYFDSVYVNEKNIPIVHIAKSSCHWYYDSFARCIAPTIGEPIKHKILRRVKKLVCRLSFVCDMRRFLH